MASKTLADKLESIKLLIFNSKDPQVAPLLETMGIDTAYIDKGEALYNETAKLVDDQKKEYQEQDLAYDKSHLEKDDAEADFDRTLKLVKVPSGNGKDFQNRLGFLENGRVYAIEPGIESSADFYDRLLYESLVTKLESLEVTAEQSNTEKTAIENQKQLSNEVTVEKGQTQEATRLRNEKLDELDNYAIELKAIAEIALEKQPQLLEKLGILVRS